MVVDHRNHESKLELIKAAGKLFAEHGFEGVSTRKIAKSASVNLGLIHYHFGTKENLYLEAFKYAVDRDKKISIPDIIEEDPDLEKTDEGKAFIIRSVVFRSFKNFFNTEKEEWTIRLIIRELSSPSSVMPTLVDTIFKPENDGAVAFYKKIKPHCSDYEARAWADMIHANCIFYISVKDAIEYSRGKNFFNKDFFNTVAKMLAKSLIVLAGLPLPEDLTD